MSKIREKEDVVVAVEAGEEKGKITRTGGGVLVTFHCCEEIL